MTIVRPAPARATLFPFIAVCVLWAAQVMAAGPDITHSDIFDTAHYGPVTVAGTPIHAYAIGSTTCNMGDLPLTWTNFGSPVLAMNMYRLSDGRLVQIGVGFCKYACCAANTAGCGITCTNNGGDAGHLYPGCQDVYVGGYNGAQARLGPRSGVDPFAGTVTPPTGTGADAIARRVQVPQPEMSATTFSGALYFAEGVYVCLEESAAQKLNNASYRRENVANTGASPTYLWTGADPTRAGRPAIYAWHDHGLGANMPDDSVTVVPVDVPGEGRFFVAGKSIALGGSPNRWRYEFAVFNLDSQRAAAQLSVPTPPGAVVTDIGFHGVKYHSGEVYDNTDWAGAAAPGAVTWSSPQTFAQNPNASALRWGTMYNFWFTSDAAPSLPVASVAGAGGSVTLGLFRPGTPTSITAPGLPVPCIPVCVADYNCTGAASVQDVFDFISDYLGARPRADVNLSGDLTIQDVFDFLAAYFASCP
jgi:hypothetical protein